MTLRRALRFFAKSAMYNAAGEIVEESAYIDPTGTYQIPEIEQRDIALGDLVNIPFDSNWRWVHDHITEFYGDIVHIEGSQFHLEQVTDRDDHKIFHIIVDVVEYDEGKYNAGRGVLKLEKVLV